MSFINKLLDYFKGYSILRWIRLVAGIIVIGEAFRTGEFIVSAIGFALVFMALTKVGCDPAGTTCAKPLN